MKTFAIKNCFLFVWLVVVELIESVPPKFIRHRTCDFSGTPTDVLQDILEDTV